MINSRPATRELTWTQKPKPASKCHFHELFPRRPVDALAPEGTRRVLPNPSPFPTRPWGSPWGPRWVTSPLPSSLRSSNGKSVTWAQNERSGRGQHLWQRLSIHINKKENPNQTAVIKPFPKSAESRGLGAGGAGGAGTSAGAPGGASCPAAGPGGGPEPPDASPKALYDVAEAEEQLPAPARPRSPSPISTLSQRAGSAGRPDDNDAPALPSEPAARSSTSQGSLMEQISSVVTRFTANISELNSMMLSTAAPGPGAGAPLCSSYLIPKEIQLPTTVTTFAEIQPLPAIEVTAGAQPVAAAAAPPAGGAALETPAPGPEAAAGKPDLEELVALTPPSPFRDSVDSGSTTPNSPVSESALCIPSSPKYDTLIIRDYTQSSSSLWESPETTLGSPRSQAGPCPHARWPVPSPGLRSAVEAVEWKPPWRREIKSAIQHQPTRTSTTNLLADSLLVALEHVGF